MDGLALRALIVETTDAQHASDVSALLDGLAAPTLRELTVHAVDVYGDMYAACIALNPTLAQLEFLSMGEHARLTSGVSARGLRALTESPSWARLHTLALGGCPVGDEGARLIAERAKPWRSLDLTGAHIGDEGARCLAQSAAMQTLERLLLGHNALGDDAANALAASPHLGALRELELCRNPLTTAGALALVERPVMPALARLGLRCEDVDGVVVQRAHPTLLHAIELHEPWEIDAAMAARLAEAWPPALELNKLSYSLAPDAFVHAARWPQLAQLDELAVGGPEHQEQLAQALLASEHLTGVRSLSVSFVPETCQIIAANHVLSRLRSLHLLEWTDDEQLCALAAATNMSELRELTLRYTDVTARGIEALMSSERLTQLESFTILGGGPILDVEIARCIARRTGLPALRKLACCCDAASLGALFDGDGLCGIDDLWIGWGIGDAELRLLAASRFAGAFYGRDVETGLRTLALYGGAPTLDGLKLLFDHPATKELEAIEIKGIDLGDDLFMLLDHHPHLKALRSLVLHRTSVSPAFNDNLNRADWFRQLIHVDLKDNNTPV